MTDQRERFLTSLRVRYAETDKMGIAYNSHYLAWFEVARTDLLRNFGLTYNDMEKKGFRLPLFEAGIKYLKPVYYDDVLTIASWILRKPGVRLRIDYEVKKNGDLVATGFTEHAFTDGDIRPVRPPVEVRKLLLAVNKASLKLKDEV